MFLDKKESENEFAVHWFCVSICLWESAAPCLSGFFSVSLWQLNTSPFSKQMAVMYEEASSQAQTVEMASLWQLLSSCYYSSFTLKDFWASQSISFAVSFLSLPLFFHWHWAVIGCYDRLVAWLSASSEADFNYSFSLTWHVHEQMHANLCTHWKVTHK